MATGVRCLRDTTLLHIALLAPILIGVAIVSQRGDLLTAWEEMLMSGALYAIVVIAMPFHRADLVPLLTRLPASLGITLLTCVIFSVISLLCAMVYGIIIHSLVTEVYFYSEPFLEAGMGWFTVFIAIAVCPALFEEIAIRGIILSRLLRVMGRWQAIFVSAVMFAILHLDVIGSVIYLIPMGLMTGWITLRTKSLYPAMLIHLLHNSAVVALEAMTNAP